MKIPEREYSIEEFKEYLTSHIDTLYKQEKRKNWLTIYSFLVNNETWYEKIFQPDEIKRLGEIIEISPKSDNADHAIYYLLQYERGLWLMYTTASKEQYRAELSKRIKNKQGITRMWLKPDVFKMFWRNILEETEGYIYNFRAQRNEHSDKSCELRPNYKRRVNYTGKDAESVIDELEARYGTIPDIIKIHIKNGFKIYMTNDGLYSAQTPSQRALDLFYSNLDLIKESVVQIWNTSNELKFDFVTGSWGQQITSVKSGKIGITANLDKTGITNLKERLNSFSFVNDFMKEGSFGYYATIIDEDKGSLFHITANNNQIIVVPKFNYTFESFIDFYRGVVEVVDEKASFHTLDEAS